MIVPVTHDGENSRRWPWLTFALLLAVAAGFVGARAEVWFLGGGSEVKLEGALEVWLAHPYLEVDPAVLASGGKADEDAERVAQARAAAAGVEVDPETRAEQQAELDYVTRLALRGSDAAPGPNHPFRRLGFVPAQPLALAFLAHPLLHAGILHVSLVLLLIWLAGPALERAYGRALFAGVCLASTWAAAGAHALTAPDSAAPLVGAWGLAAGAVGAFTVRFAGSPMRFGRDAWVAPGWAAVPAWLVASALLHLASGAAALETGDSLAPNLAGFCCGALFALALQVLHVEERRAERALSTREALALDPRTRKARDAHERGSHDQAISLATSVLRERPDDTDALQVVWSAQLAAGHETQGAPTAKRLIEVHARHGALAQAARVWDELVRSQPGTRLETTVLLRIVPELVVQARRDSAIAALRCVIAPENRSLSVGQAVRAAELAAELDPECALTAARFALERGAELADERRARLEKLARELEAKLGMTPSELPRPAAEPAPASDSPGAEPTLADTLTALAPGVRPTVPAAPSAAPAEEGFELEPTNLGESAPTTIYLTPSPAAPPAVPPEALLRARAEPSTVKAIIAVPVALDPGGVLLRIDGNAPALLTWERIQAVGVALVAGLAPKPIVVIDLALNWADASDGALEVLRMRSDSFRARALVGGEGSALEALRALLAQLLARSGAVPLPDGGSARGLPFREFPNPSAYEHEVLLVTS